MSTRIVHRPARTHQRIAAEKPIQLAAVPTVRSNGQGANIISFILPVVGGMGMVLMMMSSGNPIRMAVGAVMFVVVILGATVMFIRSKTGKRKEAEIARERFLDHLQETESEVRARAQAQLHLSQVRNPAPAALTDAIRNPFRLWERRRTDEDVLVIRIGTGVADLACGIAPKETADPMAITEPIAQAHMDRMLKRARTIENSPLAIPARGSVSIVGPAELTAEAIRAIITQAAVFHSPDDLSIHVTMPLSDPTDNGRWALWLPHLLSKDRFDGPIGRRQVSHDENSAGALITELRRRAELLQERARYKMTALDEPFLMVVANMDTPHGHAIAQEIGTIPSLDKARVTLLATTAHQQNEPSHVDVRVTLNEDRSFQSELLDRGEIRQPEQGEKGYVERALYGGFSGHLDRVDCAQATAITRALAPLRLVEDKTPDAPLEQTIGLDAMLGIEDFATYDIGRQWEPKSAADFLKVPFGIDAEAQPICLDIKESAKNGMGPHGLCVGATGSGKSEQG